MAAEEIYHCLPVYKQGYKTNNNDCVEHHSYSFHTKFYSAFFSQRWLHMYENLRGYQRGFDVTNKRLII